MSLAPVYKSNRSRGAPYAVSKINNSCISTETTLQFPHDKALLRSAILLPYVS